MQPKLIIVPDDFTEPATQALSYAGKLAERFGSHLLVIHADPLADHERTALKLDVHVRLNVKDTVPYTTRSLADWPVEAVIAAACSDGADLIVMGTHGRTGIRRLFLGSVTEEIVRLSPVPVIAVNANSTPRSFFRKVLCAVTYTPASRAALRYAADIADNASLILFRGVTDNPVDESIALQEWAPPDLAERVEVKAFPTPIAPDQMAAFAALEQIDLIAVGVPAGRSVADVLAGSLAERLLHRANCAVLTVNDFAIRRVMDVTPTSAPGHGVLVTS